MSVRALLVCLLLSSALGCANVQAQGFAGLGTSADGFAMPQRGVPFRFPADHGPHPDYRIEWWYLTANLEGPDGKQYGVQWTLFRSALAPGAKAAWSSPQIWMGNAAITTSNAHYVSERLARDGTGTAGVTATPFDARIDDWQMKSRVDEAGTADLMSDIDLRASGAEFRYDLHLKARGPIALQGEGGYSVKSAGGQASNYYSQPFYRAEGMLKLPSGDVAVTGEAWLDREWSSQPLSADQTGWDWFSLHLENGEKLMGFRLRDSGAGFTSATWISADGATTPLPPGALTITPLATTDVAGRKVPTEWRLDIPSRDFSVTTTPLNPQAWMATRFPYWEGPISFEGSQQGRGYLEMTGYN